MRVLLVEPGPAWSVQDVANGWRKGLRENGCQVGVVNLEHHLTFFDKAHFDNGDGTFRKAMTSDVAIGTAALGIHAAAFEIRPDVAIIVSGFYVPQKTYDLLRAHGVTLVQVFTESPYEDDKQLQRAHFADLNVVNDPTNIEVFEHIAPTVYLPHAYDPALHRPGPVSHDLRSDFAFCGTGFPGRIEFFEAVDWTGIDAAFAGFWGDTRPDSIIRKFIVHDLDECFDNADTTDLYRSARLSANVYREPTGWAMGPREVELAAIGTPFLRESRGEGDEVLGFLPRFTDPGDFTDQMRYLLAHDDLRLALGRRCREAVADRTFAANAAHLLRLLDKR